MLKIFKIGGRRLPCCAQLRGLHACVADRWCCKPEAVVTPPKHKPKQLDLIEDEKKPCRNQACLEKSRCDKCVVGCVIRAAYKIVRVTPDDEERVIQHLRENFFQDEPVTQALGVSGANDMIERVILYKLRHGVGLMAITPDQKRSILGVIICCHLPAAETDIVYKLSQVVRDPRIRNLFQFVSFIKYEPQLHLKLNTLKIFDVCLLSVESKARWHGIGKMLTKFAFVTGRNLGHSYVRFDTTNLYASKIAKRLDLPKVWSMNYKDYINIYEEKMFKVTGPHPSVNVYIENTRTRKLWQFERDIEAFEAKTKKLLGDN